MNRYVRTAGVHARFAGGGPRGLQAIALICATASLLSATAAEATEQRLEVTATAYNSVPWQTNSDPWIAAWGDSLEHGMKIIAVSRDLLRMGLRRGTTVRIVGLPGEYVVLDKMNRRWEKRVDVYMGSDIRSARRFGRRSVTIEWDDGKSDLSTDIAEAKPD